MNDFEKMKSKQILACYKDSKIEKSLGEGSRGGIIIGHTKSGKPIYSNFDHQDHKDFTEFDHRQASAVHNHEVNRHFIDGDFVSMEYHEKQQDLHNKAAKIINRSNHSSLAKIFSFL